MQVFGIVIALLFVVFVIIPLTTKIWNNQRFAKNGIETFGTVTNSYFTGFVFQGRRQEVVNLKYTINGKTYEGCATLFTGQIYYSGVVVPIKVNPKDPLDCSIVLT